MTIPTVAVTVRLDDLSTGPLAGYTVTATLDKADRYGGFLVPSSVSGVTDALGEVVLDCFPNNPTTGLGTTGSTYTFACKALSFRETAQVPNSACELHDIADLATAVSDSALDLHIADTAGAHAASAISVAAIAGITGTTGQAVLAELAADKEATANKDASGGYAGLTLFKLNLKNALGTITSFFSTAATVARTWTMPDKDGTVAMISDFVPAGASGQMQYNAAGAFAAANFYREDANTIAQRNGATAQEHRWNYSYTDDSNYMRGFLRFNSTGMRIGTEHAGTGTARWLTIQGSTSVEVYAGSSGVVYVGGSSGISPWRFAASTLFPSNNGTQDFGDATHRIGMIFGTALATGTVTKTGNYTSTYYDDVILADATAGNLTITLEAAAGAAGRHKTVKKIDASANTVTIDGNASETIDGATTVVLSAQWATRRIQVNAGGTAWNVLASI